MFIALALVEGQCKTHASDVHPSLSWERVIFRYPLNRRPGGRLEEEEEEEGEEEEEEKEKEKKKKKKKKKLLLLSGNESQFLSTNQSQLPSRWVTVQRLEP